MYFRNLQILFDTLSWLRYLSWLLVGVTLFLLPLDSLIIFSVNQWYLLPDYSLHR